jgi:hypothetical protein
MCCHHNKSWAGFHALFTPAAGREPTCQSLHNLSGRSAPLIPPRGAYHDPFDHTTKPTVLCLETYWSTLSGYTPKCSRRRVGQFQSWFSCFCECEVYRSRICLCSPYHFWLPFPVLHCDSFASMILSLKIAGKTSSERAIAHFSSFIG